MTFDMLRGLGSILENLYNAAANSEDEYMQSAHNTAADILVGSLAETLRVAASAYQTTHTPLMLPLSNGDGTEEIIEIEFLDARDIVDGRYLSYSPPENGHTDKQQLDLFRL